MSIVKGFDRFVSCRVSTYSRWSERHLPQIKLLAGNPSENLCPVRGGQLQPRDVLIKRGRRGRGCWSRSIESSGSMPPFGGFLSTVSTLPWTSPASSGGRPRFSTTHRASLTLVLEIGCRTHSAGQPATSRDFRGYVPWLIGEGKDHGGSPFCPLGAPFQVGAVATLYRRIRSVPSMREIRTVRRRIYGRSYRIHRIRPLVVRRLQMSRGLAAVAPSAFCLCPCLNFLAISHVRTLEQ